MPAAAMLLAAWLAVTPPLDASALFERDRARLSTPGVHCVEGTWFSVACRPAVARIPESAQRDWVRMDALQAIRRERIAQALRTDPSDRRSSTEALLRFAETLPCTAQDSTLAMQLPLPDREDATCIALALPAPEPLDGSKVRAEALAALAARAQSGKATGPEALLLLQLDERADVSGTRAAAMDCLDRAYGDGLSATVERRWATRSGAPLRDGLALWNASARFAALAAERADRGETLQEGELRGQDLPDSDPARWPRLSPEERLHALGRRAGDPGLAAMVQADLRNAGWTRLADMLPTGGTTPEIPPPASGSRLDLRARQALLADDAVTAMLLSGGTARIAVLPGASPAHETARQSFNEGSPEQLNRAVRTLCARRKIGGGLHLDDASLLSAALLALEEPGLAAPVAATAYRAGPSHPYAGVNLLLALRALDRVDQARQLLPALEASPSLDPWGRQQLAAIRAWTGP